MSEAYLCDNKFIGKHFDTFEAIIIFWKKKAELGSKVSMAEIRHKHPVIYSFLGGFQYDFKGFYHVASLFLLLV